jgi:peptidoglycan/xylan/chitin deacetylase (PgdA/CDA1 family)
VHDVSSVPARRQVVRQLIGALKYLPLPERTARTEGIAGMAGVPIPGDLMMSSAEVRALHYAGMEIGGHTVRHPILARIPDEEARAEIEEGRAQVAAITGVAPATFAYPNGRPGQDYLPRHVDLVRQAGFSHALSTTAGCVTPRSSRYELPRLALWSRSTPRLLANLSLMYGRETLPARAAG